MSKNNNRAKVKHAFNNKIYKALLLEFYYPVYSDDGVYMYPPCRRGFKNSNKQIYSYQVRMYKTWKHTRLHQWK